VVLHAAGLTSMAVRYPLAVGTAYLMFLVLVSWFVAYHRRRRGVAGPPGDRGSDVYWWVDPGPAPHAPAAAAPAKEGGFGFNLGDADGEGVAVVVAVVLIVIAVASAFVAAAFVVIDAPLLLAE